MRKLVVFAVKVLLLLFGRVPIAESVNFTRKPADPTVVMEGVNSTQVQLVWNFTYSSNLGVSITRESPDGSETQVASGIGPQFRSRDSDYEVNLPATLVIKEVTRTEYVYRFNIIDMDSFQQLREDLVTVKILYSPEFTNVSDNQTVTQGDPSITLVCTAIGEPPPNITWTRVLDNGSDSNVLFTGEQFVLDSNRSSSGIYRCTASNGIGTAPNRTIVVDVNCK